MFFGNSKFMRPFLTYLGVGRLQAGLGAEGHKPLRGQGDRRSQNECTAGCDDQPLSTRLRASQRIDEYQDEKPEKRKDTRQVHSDPKKDGMGHIDYPPGAEGRCKGCGQGSDQEGCTGHQNDGHYKSYRSKQGWPEQ